MVYVKYKNDLIILPNDPQFEKIWNIYVRQEYDRLLIALLRAVYHNLFRSTSNPSASL